MLLYIIVQLLCVNKENCIVSLAGRGASCAHMIPRQVDFHVPHIRGSSPKS